jgi:hypothetical protein
MDILHPLKDTSTRCFTDDGTGYFMNDDVDYDCVVDDGYDYFIDNCINHITYDINDWVWSN